MTGLRPWLSGVLATATSGLLATATRLSQRLPDIVAQRDALAALKRSADAEIERLSGMLATLVERVEASEAQCADALHAQERAETEAKGLREALERRDQREAERRDQREAEVLAVQVLERMHWEIEPVGAENPAGVTVGRAVSACNLRCLQEARYCESCIDWVQKRAIQMGAVGWADSVPNIFEKASMDGVLNSAPEAIAWSLSMVKTLRTAAAMMRAEMEKIYGPNFTHGRDGQPLSPCEHSP